MSTAAAPAPARQPRPWLLTALALLLAATALWTVSTYTSPYASNADASGYLHHARLLAADAPQIPLEPIVPLEPPRWRPILQQPLGFAVAPDGQHLVPTYPVGYPLHLRLAAAVVGFDRATILTNVLLTAAAGLLLGLLAHRWGLPPTWSLAAVALFFASPLFLHISTQPMSDLCATVWVLAALGSAQRGVDTDRLRWFALAGLATGLAVLVRPTNVFLVAPLIWLLRTRARAWLVWALTGIPAALFLAWHQLRLYGSPFATGYGSANVLPYLSFAHAPGALRHFALGLGLHLSPWVAASIVGLPWLRRPERGFFITWIAAFGAFYACYSFSTGDWWGLRFLLPAFPALLISALLIWRRWLQVLPSSRLATALALSGLIGAFVWQGVTADRHYALIMKRGEVIYAEAAQWINDHTPANAIVLASQASGAICYYTGRDIVRPELLRPADAIRLQQYARAGGRPLYAVAFGGEAESFQAKLGRNWTEHARYGIITLWSFEVDAPE
ncbi:ArnT family glycosyltransferase [Actomonas aquatica]|uniref:Glycosyltransferase family 39 protein n=1 Tax=Actomonas aquatica TaxID=2866162 RepID=A0ABZ1C291_9BACT|nr:glycosyltransferase family 39 protein [Opitutus sp. WL0086]WRQ85811.1 glycosyltransferase family 39 protein [Opitutus sp. WL0086]